LSRSVAQCRAVSRQGLVPKTRAATRIRRYDHAQEAQTDQRCRRDHATPLLRRPERIAALEEARANDEVVRKICQLRTRAGLTQRQLAKPVGTTASVICRLEDAEYEGHSLLLLLRRIATALDRRVEIRFMPLRNKPPLTGKHGLASQ